MHTFSPVPQPAGEAPTLGPTGTGGGCEEVLSLCPRGRAGSAEFASAQTNLKSERTCCRSSTSALLLQPTPWAVHMLVLFQAHGGQGKARVKVLHCKRHTVLSGICFAMWPAILIFKTPLLII